METIITFLASVFSNLLKSTVLEKLNHTNRLSKSNIKRAITNTEKRMLADFLDRKMLNVFLKDGILNAQVLQKAWASYYQRPLSLEIRRAITTHLRTRLPGKYGNRLERFIATYISFFEQELALLDREFERRLRIVNDLHEFSNQNRQGKTQVTKKIYQNLLKVPTDFTGRKKELVVLRESVNKKGITISSIRGLGGIGKTVLGLKLANQIKELFPDGQIFIDLKGFGGSRPLTPRQAMTRVIRAIDSEVILPTKKSDLHGYYLSVLEGKKFLLFFDNARGPYQVDSLIPPDPCFCIITSRRRFLLPGLFSLDLTRMSREDARKFLLKIEPGIGKHADLLAELCDRIPLALRLAAFAIRGNDLVSAKQYIERLQREPAARLKLIESKIRQNYMMLTPSLRRYWRLLGVFPSSFDLGAATFVLGLKEEQALAVIDKLVNLSLVEVDKTTQRLYMHDLLRLFARRHSSVQERILSGHAHAKFYLKRLEAFKKRSRSLSFKAGKALQLDFQNFVSGFNYAGSRKDQDGIDMVVSYCDLAEKLLSPIMDAVTQLEWARKGVARVRKNNLEKASILSWLGSIQVARGNAAEALTTYRKAISIHLRFDRDALGFDYAKLGYIYAELGELKQSYEFSQRALKLAGELKKSSLEAEANYNLGYYWGVKGDLQRSIRAYKKALALALKCDDTQMIAGCKRNIGNRLASSGNSTEGARFLKAAIRQYKKNKDKRGEAVTLGILAVVSSNLKKHALALKLISAAIGISRSVADRRMEGDLLSKLGEIYTKAGDSQRAKNSFKEALLIRRKIIDRRGEGKDLINLGRIYKAQGFYSLAFTQYKTSERLLKKTEDFRLSGLVAYEKMLLFVQMEDISKAKVELNKARRFWRATEDPRLALLPQKINLKYVTSNSSS